MHRGYVCYLRDLALTVYSVHVVYHGFTIYTVFGNLLFIFRYFIFFFHPLSNPLVSQVLDAIQPVMNKASGREQTVYRAKFSSITDTDIWNAMNCLGEPNRNEALSVEARQELDLRIGCAFTRYVTSWSPTHTYIHKYAHLFVFL